MLSTHSVLQNWSINRPHLEPAAQFLSILYPGLTRIRIKESDYYNLTRIRISVKVRSSEGGDLLRGVVYASHLDEAVSRIIQRISSQPEMLKLAKS